MNWKKVLGACAALFVLLCAFCVGYLHWYHPREPHKSRLLAKKITAFAIEDPALDLPVSSARIARVNAILDQPFYYIGEGKQCTAYVSKDGKYVLKFLLQRPLLVKARYEQLPDFFPFSLLKKYKVYMRQERKKSIFDALTLSFKTIPELTGMLYVHLNPTKSLLRQPLIIDTKGNSVSIDIDATQFVLQKRARHIKPTIINLMWEGKTDEAKQRVDQVLRLLYDAAKKGIVDVDQGLVRRNNIGFIKSQAIYVDVGKLRHKQRLQARDFTNDLKRLRPFYKWLKIYYPDLAEYYLQRQKEYIDTF